MSVRPPGDVVAGLRIEFRVHFAVADAATAA